MVKTSDEFFMGLALEEAKRAFEQEEVPVGAVLVIDGQLISSAHNQVEKTQDASQHAEMNCLRIASQNRRNWRLNEATLYCTLEPCAMCLGAMLLFRVKKLVWGAPDFRHGANGSICDLMADKHPIHRVEVSRGVRGEESAALLKEFFKIRRKTNV